jgi:hypothetical protein
VLESGTDVVAGCNGDVLVLANTGTAPVPLPPGATPLLASGPLAARGTAGHDGLGCGVAG